MDRVVVAGIVNVESSVPVESFPVGLDGSRFERIGIAVSGVGFNVGAGLTALGTLATLLAFIGNDPFGATAEHELRNRGLWGPGIIRTAGETPHSVVLYDPAGHRQVFTDLAGVPDRGYPVKELSKLFDGVSFAVLTNVGFTRPLLQIASDRGVRIATDVHTISDLHDSYNRDYMAHADVLFMSHERLPVPAHEWTDELMATYLKCAVAVVGMGIEGCYVKERGEPGTIVPAVTPRPVVSTVGAGDALVAAFVHYTVAGFPPQAAVERAVAFAGWKIGESGGSRGFPTPSLVESLVSASPPSSKLETT